MRRRVHAERCSDARTMTTTDSFAAWRAVFRMALVAAALACTATNALAADNPAEVFELPSVDVVGTTPLPGLGTALRDVPANIQRFGAREIGRQRQPTLTQFLEQNANSVSAASGQGNPYQQSFDFRGLTASPLLGAPQGISVFQDGVRINEAFGDVVNWDLLPRSAISSVQLLPGSMPAFGLNTLGGALAIYTKSGAQYPGASVEVSGGSFGTKTAEFEYGGASDRLDWFATGHFSDDDGWAEHNPSRVKQFFGKVGYQDDKTDIDLTLTLADNTLHGTQTLPLSFLENPRQAYTFPDENVNKLGAIAAKGSRFLSDDVLLGANAYYRHYKASTFASNVNEDFALSSDDDAPTSEAFNDRSTIDQRTWGVGAQVTLRGEVASTKHQLIVGISGDFGNTRFGQQEQTASFTPDRGTEATGPFATTNDVALRNAYTGVYFGDTIALAERWTLTVAGRWNRAHVEIADRSGEDAALNGSHTFTRFNPSVGVNFNPMDALTAYASYNEGMRAPTPIELTCADPTAPCRLPNEFLADPPLNKVVSKTFELGARGRINDDLTWSAAIYRTDLDDDIQFISSGGGVNAGFFRNVGSTRRQGIELGTTARHGPLALDVRYNHIDATFRSTFAAFAPNNSSADENGAIVVTPGRRIPGIPNDAFKLRLDYASGPVEIGAGLVAVSSQYSHGDENNIDRNGKVPGYAVVNLDAHYEPVPGLSIFALVSNLFDKRYYNFAVLGQNFFTGPGRSFGPASGVDPVPEQFRAVGAPRGIWVGLRYRFGAKAGS
jgi:outer membrane receptor protein involved in Fe transport